MIRFPEWVKDPTPCKTRSLSMVFTGFRHGAIRRVTRVPNLLMVKRRRVGLPGYYMGYAVKCSVTGKYECKDRKCELHYMDAPLKLVES